MNVTCRHDAPPVLLCPDCVVRLVEPPQSPKPRNPNPTHRPRAYVATVDGRTYTFEGVGFAIARRALAQLLGRSRAPRDTTWKAQRMGGPHE